MLTICVNVFQITHWLSYTFDKPAWNTVSHFVTFCHLNIISSHDWQNYCQGKNHMDRGKRCQLNLVVYFGTFGTLVGTLNFKLATRQPTWVECIFFVRLAHELFQYRSTAGSPWWTFRKTKDKLPFMRTSLTSPTVLQQGCTSPKIVCVCAQATLYFTAFRRFNQFHLIVRFLSRGFSVLRVQSSQGYVSELEGACESEKRSN